MYNFSEHQNMEVCILFSLVFSQTLPKPELGKVCRLTKGLKTNISWTYKEHLSLISVIQTNFLFYLKFKRYV